MHSRSAVGEQFVELTPETAAAGDTASPLRDGDVIPVGRVQIPADIGSLLDATNRALQAIPQDNLRTVVDEADKAVAGLGPELSRIVDGSTSLAIEAGKTVDPITQLIDQSPPVLNSQVQTADSIAAWAERMASITGQLKAQDAAFADLLNMGGPALNEGTALFDRRRPRAAGAAGQPREPRRYRGDLPLRHRAAAGALPAGHRGHVGDRRWRTPIPSRTTRASISTSTSTSTCRRRATPASCRCGSSVRPSDVDAPERPAGELYCRVPQDSDLNVRGVRNIPCETVPGKRAPTVEMCESNEQYVPLNDGYNWKGDPNATLSGQGVPQYAPGADPRLPPPAGTGAAFARHPAHRLRRSRSRHTIRPPATTSGPTGSATPRPTSRTRRTRPGSQCWSLRRRSALGSRHGNQ